MKTIKHINIVVALFGFTLYGCSNDNTPTPNSDVANTTASYEIIFTNLTANQPISPMAVVLHTNGYTIASLGSAASISLEKLAEGGDNAPLLSEAAANTSVLASYSGVGLLMPGATETVTATVADSAGLALSMAGMLVNTNDGFAALQALDLSNLAIGVSQTAMLAVFDAGTEDNTEVANTLPGQAGVGFDMLRNDVNFISVHRGVVTATDGLTTSALNESHRFDNPSVRVSIRRIS